MSSTTKTTTQAKRIRKPGNGTQAPHAVPVTTKARRTPSSAVTETNRPPHADLSFVHREVTRYGWISTNWFDVPDEEYGDGWMTGLRAFQELQQFIKTQPKEDDWSLTSYVQWMLEKAFKARAAAAQDGKSKRGAASAFAHCAGQFLNTMLRANDGQHMADMIASHQRAINHQNARDAQARAAFIARMQAGRAAKRAAREAVKAPTAAVQGVQP
jgi:hypothetical protein